jgi:hypothetical protein
MKSLAATGLLSVSMLAVTAPADAGVNIGIRVDRGSRYYDGGRVAYNRGFEDGYREGQKDGRKGDRYGFWDEGRYRDGDHGYNRRYGSRWEYTSVYRRGFEEGYRRAYGAFSRYRYYGDDRYRDDRYRDYRRDPYYDDRDRDRYDDRYYRDRYRR